MNGWAESLASLEANVGTTLAETMGISTGLPDYPDPGKRLTGGSASVGERRSYKDKIRATIARRPRQSEAPWIG
jgi:hypothetical protein